MTNTECNISRFTRLIRDISTSKANELIQSVGTSDAVATLALEYMESAMVEHIAGRSDYDTFSEAVYVFVKCAIEDFGQQVREEEAAEIIPPVNVKTFEAQVFTSNATGLHYAVSIAAMNKHANPDSMPGYQLHNGQWIPSAHDAGYIIEYMNEAYAGAISVEVAA